MLLDEKLGITCHDIGIEITESVISTTYSDVDYINVTDHLFDSRFSKFENLIQISFSPSADKVNYFELLVLFTT